LKSEIEVFLSNIFLRVLESPNSSFEQKAVVVESLRSLCSDPVLLTQIFLNYDCDFDAVNLYKDIVHHLTKLAGKSTGATPVSQTKKEAEQEFELSLGGTEVLVTILRSFLKALGLPGGDDTSGNESASARLQSLLQLDVGLAVIPPAKKGGSIKRVESTESDEGSVSSKESKMSAVSALETGSASSEVAGKIVESFEMKRTAEHNFQLGTVKFTLSIKNGLQYFVENKFVELDACKIAQFFLTNKDRLDKTQMGEVLGKEPDSRIVKGEEDPEKGGPGFYVRVLHHYVDAMDFTGMMFDDAIRLFLSGFRLPGEAQKIDRIMEKFAERYTRQNLDVFPSADTAFILAFSVIMLNTDLHNPSIKPEKRMTVESFIRNNRGISVDGGDLPEEFLTGIFDRIKTNPFSLKEDDEARKRHAGAKQEAFDTTVLFDGPSFFGTSADERKREKFRKEREEMMAATEQLFKKRPGKTKGDRGSQVVSAMNTESVAPSDVVKPMFDATWGPLIGTLSQVLECSNDERSIAVCLNGFVYAVRIAAHSNMSLARDTFVNSLAKFTFLGSAKEMKQKNIESIRTLLSIAVIDGEYLGESWGPVLQCISQLARLRLLSSGLDADENFLADKEMEETKKKIEEDLVHGGGFFRQPTQAEVKRETEEFNGRAVLTAVNEVLIDRVFSSTVKLSANSIAHFIEQLVAVSAMEISGDSTRGITGVGQASTRQLGENGSKLGLKTSKHGEEGPRIFSLQRLVEVADYNMDVRPRIAWAQVWGIMADHFAKIGCHENAMVTSFAIDSLKQLSFKFLEKPELSDFNFQSTFLRPFLQIMENKGTREDIRELILRCVDNMVRTKSHNLRSGWKIFFSILTLSARDSSERINTLGLAILQRLLDEHLHQLCRLTDADEGDISNVEPDGEMSALEKRNRNANVEDFIGLCRASLSFVQTNQTTSPIPIGLSMRALCHTACYADLLADHRVLPPVSGAQVRKRSDDKVPTGFVVFFAQRIFASRLQSRAPHVPGYTYEGLSGEEALEMVLWRPLLDGLTEGVRSTFPSMAGGEGCLVQRGSVLALRAILLRHGHVFSTNQWLAFLKQSLLPSIQVAAEADVSPVVRITSETPSVSNLDFLAESQRLPPRHDDEGLQKFAERTRSEESAPKRPLGQAELLVEASFMDMRHGGDGNLSRAYELGKKDEEEEFSEQPFPDSWIATTAPIALGLLTDIASEIFLRRGADGREKLWPLILEQLQVWAIGRPESFEGRGRPISRDDFLHDNVGVSWQPCEALIRTSCRELNRFPRRLADVIPELEMGEDTAWTDSVIGSIAETLAAVVSVEDGTADELVRIKLKAYGIEEAESFDRKDLEKSAEDMATSNGTGAEPSPLLAMVSQDEEDVDVEVIMYTPYGKGHLTRRRHDTHMYGDKSMSLTMNVITLDFGGTLYRPAPGTVSHDMPDQILPDEPKAPSPPRRSLKRGTLRTENAAQL
jgi:Sec7-like guanine-nucleotide exchange factor